MARKTATVNIDRPGRDFGKVFVLTEMPASQAERWATRALMALARGGIEVPDDIASAGLAGVAAVGLPALGALRYEDAEPLLDEMFGCVRIMPDASRPMVTRALIEDDIEEVVTRLRLRAEVFKLHVDFSLAAAPSALDPGTPAATGLPTTPTSAP